MISKVYRIDRVYGLMATLAKLSNASVIRGKKMLLMRYYIISWYLLGLSIGWLVVAFGFFFRQTYPRVRIVLRYWLEQTMLFTRRVTGKAEVVNIAIHW